MGGEMQVIGLSVSYGDNQVLRGIDLTIAAGKVLAIVGPSGCGKTTLLRCLNRLTDLTRRCRVEGAIGLDGEDIFSMDPVMLRRRVGMVFQKPNPFPMSIKENILYGVKAHGKRNGNSQSIVKSALEGAALWNEVQGRLNDSAFTLSLGQQQRLCFARSMAVSPEVILMDEPAASLDPVSTAKLESSIVAMKGEYTMVIVTHDVPQARRVSDHLAFLHGGGLMEFGETEKVFENPEREETRAYLAGRLLAV
jgi:phosphate transport system ATP-binding protein